jgi:hypothetical protein
MAKKRKPTQRKKSRPLLLAAAGAAVLFMGCGVETSGNLMALPYDMSVPDDLSPPPDLKTRD